MKRLLLACLRWAGRLRCRCGGAELGPGVLVHGWPRVKAKGSGRILIGKGATVNSAFWANPFNERRTTLYAAPGAVLELAPGAGVSGCQIIAHERIVIGGNSLIGAGTLICDSDMHEVPLGSGKPVATAPVLIGCGVFIGTRCLILKGVTIGDGAVIGAGTVVAADVPARTLLTGPGAVVRREWEGTAGN